MLWLVVSTVLVVAVPFSVAIVFSFLSRYRTQLQLQSDGSPEQKRACRHGIVPINAAALLGARGHSLGAVP